MKFLRCGKLEVGTDEVFAMWETGGGHMDKILLWEPENRRKDEKTCLSETLNFTGARFVYPINKIFG